ncbi:hypothetical protein BG846_05373 [Streptomyces fradiae ATCC 10745 = DSM 40063]|uniref:Uncharacterized protein n=1 Tax=Streptomyces fradiae ATCC 10745 = DSM 40063 TaxID=1319510 RepID=A0A1Y2NNS0_STRFR|nr:hypothetical protein BG846_05373 [Streptomyces fradiae ATCC 10745 = DSM 40063]
MAPFSSDLVTSKTDASKLGEANWSTREPGRTSMRSRWVRDRSAMPRWVTTTPLGRPVEPEV